MNTRQHYIWWYYPVFLLAELVQSVIGLVTLTAYRPNLTLGFAQWYARRRLRVTTWG